MRTRLSFVVVCSVLLMALTPPALAGVHRVDRQDIGNALYAVATAPNGSVYVTGDKAVSITRKAILVKLAPNGDREWSRSWLAGKRSSGRGVAVAVMPNGNVAWVGIAQKQCEGHGWFLEVRRPGGALIHRYITKGWQCEVAEDPTDLAVSNGLIVVSGYDFGCCGNVYEDGWVRAFDGTGHRIWQTDFEPPAPTPSGWYDRATGVSIDAGDHVWVGGWAATKRIESDTDTVRGTAVMEKLASSGAVLWTKRLAGTSMPSIATGVALSARGSRVMVTAGIGGAGVWRHARPTTGWVAAYTLGGDAVWSRMWDATKPRASDPLQIGIDGTGATWIVGQRRDVRHGSVDMFVRRYAFGGALSGWVSSGDSAWTAATWVAPTVTGAYVSGFTGRDTYQTKTGRLWRFAG